MSETEPAADPPHPEGRAGWLWVPSLYFAEAVAYAVVSDTALFFYNDLGVNKALLGDITGSMTLPWVVKPLWSPLVDLVRTKRWWIVLMQAAMAVIAFFGLAAALHTRSWPFWTTACLWAMATTSATHDIAADGFYMLGLPERYQAAFNGVRSTFYKIGGLCGKGCLVYIAGRAGATLGKFESWSLVFTVPGIAYLAFAAYHAVALPKPEADRPAPGREFIKGYVETLRSFFAKPNIGVALAFMLLFRLPEAQLLAMVAPFLTGTHHDGGLALTTAQSGIAYATVGMLGIICGGVLAGFAVARWGLRPTYWPLVLTMHLPNFCFLALAFTQPTNLGLISVCMFVEQFGYGFGFTAYTLYLMYFSRGPQRTSHYAICTGFMALGMMVPRIFSGHIAAALGFKGFYFYVVLCTLPSLFVSWLAWRERAFLDYFPPSQDA